MTEIKLTPSGEGQYDLLLDGQNISAKVTRVTIEVSAQKPPRVVLELGPGAIPTVDLDNAKVDINSDMRDWLVGIGWLPPQEENDG